MKAPVHIKLLKILLSIVLCSTLLPSAWALSAPLSSDIYTLGKDLSASNSIAYTIDDNHDAAEPP